MSLHVPARVGHMKDSLWSVALFRCESILLRSHWVMVVMDQFTRRIVGFSVHAGGADGPGLCRMFNDIVSRQAGPRYLSSDNSPLFEHHRWQANLHILNIEAVRTVPYVPLSRPFIERLIATVRREYLDHILFWNARDLQRKLVEFQSHYNEARVHSSLEGRTPAEVAELLPSPAPAGSEYRWHSACGGLYELPIAA